jgi:hypothetical protein
MENFDTSAEEVRDRLEDMDLVDVSYRDETPLHHGGRDSKRAKTVTAACYDDEFPEEFWDLKSEIEKQVIKRSIAEDNFENGSRFWYEVVEESKDNEYTFVMRQVFDF